MTELFGIKGPFDFLDYIDVLLFVILIFLVFHFLILRIFATYKPKIKEKKVILPKIAIEKIALNKLNKLNLNDLREVFFVNFNDILRDFFEDYGIKNAHNKNLSEIEKENIGNQLLEVFRENYYMIFDEKREDSIEKRQNLLEKTKYYLSK